MKIRLTIEVTGEIGDDPQDLANLQGEAPTIQDGLIDLMACVGLRKQDEARVTVTPLPAAAND